jgi:hypothetical protein
VRALLAMSGVSPSDEEVADLVAGFTGARAMVASLYAMPGVRYAEPAVVFHARAAARSAGAGSDG